ncbi:hypothetical protein Bca52824_032209 [Brassica carinata]|uniref:Kinesin motor domain-containing protein n=1 Tax=Brassica carinata TaxID=52824 RepID=A0A8X7SCA3_BRACI|nr:hypothetical protein Bca52824_032209 [Brassica carinata]
MLRWNTPIGCRNWWIHSTVLWVGKIQMNENSSRSYFVFTLRISVVNELLLAPVFFFFLLNLIDLAGRERLSNNESTGDRPKENQAINKGVSSLGDVIFSLGKYEDHVPLQKSKLTYLLQAVTQQLMFVNIAPECLSIDESLCSFRFAARVNGCEIGTPRSQTNIKPLDRLSLG